MSRRIIPPRIDVAVYGDDVDRLQRIDADIKRLGAELAWKKWQRDELLDILWRAVGTDAVAAVTGLTPHGVRQRLSRHRIRRRRAPD